MTGGEAASLAVGLLLLAAGCGGDAAGGPAAPRPAGSAVPAAPPNAESAGSEAVPQTWVSAAHGRGPTPRAPRQAPPLPGGTTPAPSEL